MRFGSMPGWAMLRLMVFFFGGLLLANVVIMTFEAARSAISAKQITAGTEHKAPNTGDSKPMRVAADVKSEKAEPRAAAQPPQPQSDWVHRDRFDAHAEPIERPLPQWLRRP